MIRHIIATSALCILGSPLLALCTGTSYFERLTPAETAEIETFAGALPYGQGTQWTLTRGPDTLTLIGTIHIFDARLDAVMADLRNTVQTVELILLEATPIEEARLQTAIASDPAAIFITQGATLPERLDAATWTRLMEAAAARGVPAPLTAKMQPWYLSIMLAMPSCILAETAAGKRGLDHLIMQAATTADVPMQALEPFDTLIKIFQDGDADKHLDMLKLSLTDEITQMDMFTAMSDSYFAQDIGSLMGLSQIAARHTPNLDPATAMQMVAESEHAILTDRNIAWMPIIAQATQAHDTIFIGVGAAHLPGEQGLLKLLENEGWVITPR